MRPTPDHSIYVFCDSANHASREVAVTNLGLLHDRVTVSVSCR